MNNASMAYNELALKKIPRDSLVNLFNEIDTSICQHLIEKGYSSDDVEDVLMLRSYGFQNTAPERMKAYLDEKVPPGHLGHPQNIPISEAYNREKDTYFPSFQQLLLDVDAEIICDLKDQKYSMKNILQAFSQFSPINFFISNKDLLARYKSAVIEQSNSAHFQRFYKTVENAEKLYKDLLLNQVGKHKGYTMDNISHVREGSIVLSMMMEHDVPIDVIGKVLEKHSPFIKIEGPEYTSKIMHRLTSIKNAYTNIANANEADVNKDLYQLYYSVAKDYMKRTGTKILCARDDEKILGELMRRSLNKEQIVTVLAASPVALEIGRNLHDYVMNLSEFYHLNYENIKTLSLNEVKDKAYERNKYYENYFNLDIIGSSKDLRFIHSLICKDLLSLGCNPDYIPLAMEEIVKDSKENEHYVADLVYPASEAVKAEQNIKNFRLPVVDTSSEKHSELELTTQERYIMIAREKIKDNPSFIRRWSYSSELDTDILETVLVKFPDTDTEELKSVLMANSPKALLAKDIEAYSDEVMGKLTRRNELNKIGQKLIEAKQEEYTKQCGIAVEGTLKDNYMDSYVDGKVAIKLLQSGKSPLEVRNAILMAAEPKGKSPGEYADGIVERALKVTDRLKKIASHVPTKAVFGAAVGFGALYLDYLSDQYSMKGFIQSKMDIDAFYMLQQKGVEPEKIKEVIKEYSPVYVEPGRNEEYLDYIESYANEKLLEEQQKLEYYKAVARENHEDYLNEYAKHQRDLQKNIDLAYSEAMDEIIAEAMMIQGFSDSEIAKALEKSPVRDSTDYSNKIIEKAKDKMIDYEVIHNETVVQMAPIISIDDNIIKEEKLTKVRHKRTIRERIKTNEDG